MIATTKIVPLPRPHSQIKFIISNGPFAPPPRPIPRPNAQNAHPGWLSPARMRALNGRDGYQPPPVPPGAPESEPEEPEPLVGPVGSVGPVGVEAPESRDSSAVPFGEPSPVQASQPGPAL